MLKELDRDGLGRVREGDKGAVKFIYFKPAPGTEAATRLARVACLTDEAYATNFRIVADMSRNIINSVQLHHPDAELIADIFD